MHMLATDYPHINVTPDSVPMLAGTKTKVIEVALDRLAHHWDVDEMHRQHPHLTRGQICSLLATITTTRMSLIRLFKLSSLKLMR